MEPPQYAVVAYIQDILGCFVGELRREFDPSYGHLPAHITVLPPRLLRGPEREARGTLEALCRNQQPFEIAFGDVESFVPRTPVVFIRVAHAAYKMRELHDRLNTGPLLSDEPWPYMPHLTIIKSEAPERAQLVLPEIRQRWTQYHGPRRTLIDELTFVRQTESLQWQDLAPIQLGSSLLRTRE
ncbi:MAG TPA: 2'-5' RNA ligase family protein [Terriglobales bacterium]|jgi:2'-5' RNA ligase|nr:2'-5' RNA ligase family protein [Terriglobales bacterium]